MGKQHYINIGIRLILFLANGIGVFMAFYSGYHLSGWGLSIFLCLQLFLFVDYLKLQFMDIEKSIDCLLYNDYSNTISAHKRKNSLHNKTALLLEKHRKQALEESSDKLIFTTIVESLSIGVLILKKDENNQITVFQQNTAFIEFLKIPKYMNWDLLQPKIQALLPFIHPESWTSQKHTITLQVNEQEENFFLKTSHTQTASSEYLVLTLETIQQLIEKKEKESWYKLMNVMSHEIINTITPISSLAENLGVLLQDSPIDEDTTEELAHGLKIINKRSTHLNTFVNTYRKLTELPQPKMARLQLDELVKHTIGLYAVEFKEKQITASFTYTEPCIIYADKAQIEQVLINLISNSIHALVETKHPKINLHLHKENNRVFLKISDNGQGIPDDIKSNIFIPYFTTRKDGSGIGLTLSKHILNAHNGFIVLDNNQELTTFTISFPTISIING